MRNITSCATYSLLCSTAHKSDDAAGQHGDLLDLIALSCGLDRLADVLAEARRFLGLAQPTPTARSEPPDGLPEAARRLLVMSYPLAGTVAETYLRARGIAITPDLRALRFHARCFYRTTDEVTGANHYEVWPALLATVTDLDGKVTGLHRTWLDPSGRDKAPVPSPRRALGEIAGHGVRFGTVDDVMAAGEGLETVLSVRTVLPAMPMAAALSANHLALFRPPPTLRRIYVAQDNDATGRRAAQQLSCRAQAGGIEAITLAPRLKDFNDDLRQLGFAALRGMLRDQLVLEDVSRFMLSEAVTVR
jgi:Toprim domain